MQLGIGRTLIAWMQSTYVPVGGLGDMVVSVSETLGPYNQNTAALPQSYGALARIYTDLRRDAGGRFVRASNSHIVWSVIANGVFGEPADALNTPEHYYFTLPSFAQQVFGGEELERAVDLSGHPVLGRYPSYFTTSVNGNRKYIMLTKDNRLPWVAVTRGEYLSVIEAAVGRLYAAEKKKIDGGSDSRSRASAMTALDGQQARRLATLASNREKYRNRLSEPAMVAATQPDALLENTPDVFEQWVVVSWTAQMTDPASQHLHDAVIRAFDFEYVRDYFFDPEKVTGRGYAPRK